MIKSLLAQPPRRLGECPVPAVRMPSRRPLASLDSWILLFGEAVPAADWITAARSLPGIEAVLAADLITAAPKWTKNLQKITNFNLI